MWYQGQLLMRAALPAAALFALLCWLYYPGFLQADAAYQYMQAKTGLIDNLHPPLMSYLWQAVDRVNGDYGLFWMLSLAVYVIAAALLSQALFPDFRARLAVLLLLVLWPPHLNVMTVMTKDAWLLPSLLLAVAALLQEWRRGKRIWLAVAFAALFFAAAIRYNALPALLPLIGWACWRWQRTAKAAAAMTLAVTLAIGGGVWVVNQLPRIQTAKAPLIQLWDLAALSLKSGHMLLPPSAWGINPLTLEDVARDFTPATNTSLCRMIEGKGRPLACLEPLPLRTGPALTPQVVHDIDQAWRQAVIDYPALYLEHRWQAFCLLLTLCPHAMRGVDFTSVPPDFFAGAWYSGPRPEHFGLQVREVANPLGLSLAQRFDWLRQHTPLMSGWPYLLSLLASALWLWRWRHRPLAQLGLAVNMSGWLLTLPLFFIVPNLSIRYLIWPIAASMLCWMIGLRMRRSSATTS